MNNYGDLAPEWKIIDGQVKKIISLIVHEVNVDTLHKTEHMLDPIKELLLSEKGKWVYENKLEPLTVFEQNDFALMTIRVFIVARLYESDATYFTLKWK